MRNWVLVGVVCLACSALLVDSSTSADSPAELQLKTSSSSKVVLREPFDGQPLLAWQVIRPDPSHLSMEAKPGAMTITTQRGSIHQNEKADLYGGGIQAKNIHVIENPLREEADYAVAVRISGFEPDTQFQQAGLILYGDDDNYIKLTYEYDWQRGEGQGYCSLVESQAESAFQYFEAPEVVDQRWLRIVRRGEVYELTHSTNGTRFETMAELVWKGAPFKRMGIIAKNGGNPDAPDVPVHFEEFEVRSMD